MLDKQRREFIILAGAAGLLVAPSPAATASDTSAIKGLRAVATGAVVAVMLAAKFVEGAWLRCPYVHLGQAGTAHTRPHSMAETELRGWGGRTRTQKCRRKLSL